MPQRFLAVAHLCKLRIANHEVAGDEAHLDAGFPVLVLLFPGPLCVRRVGIVALFTVGFHPGGCALELVLIVDAELHPANELAHVDVLVAHAEVVLVEALGDVAAGDAHARAAHGEVALAPHVGDGDSGAGEEQEFVLNVRRYGAVVGVLDVLAVDPERGNALLVVAGEGGGEIDGAGALGSVKTPDRLGDEGGHVDRFRSVAPARGHRE